MPMGPQSPKKKYYKICAPIPLAPNKRKYGRHWAPNPIGMGLNESSVHMEGGDVYIHLSRYADNLYEYITVGWTRLLDITTLSNMLQKGDRIACTRGLLRARERADG